MAVKLKWNGKRFAKLCDAAMYEGIKYATADLKRIARKMAGIQNTGVTVPVRRQTKGGNTTTRTIYPHSSRPGESPRRRTGVGQAGIQSGTDKVRIAGRVGFVENVRYMAMWEVGIKGVKRPTIVPSVVKNADRLSEAFKQAAMRYRFPG